MTKKNRFFCICFLIFTLFILGGCSKSAKKEAPVTHGFWRSLDAGKSWEYLSSSKTSDRERGVFPVISIYGFEKDPYIDNIVYALSEYGLWRTFDFGTSWQQLTNGMKQPGEKAILTSLVFNTFDTNIMLATGYFGGALGKIFKSSDGGDSWKEIYRELSERIPVIGVGIDPNNPANVYAMSRDLGIKESFDGGETWKRIRWLSDEITELREANALQFLVHPFDVSRMALLTDKGMYFSNNKGTTWTALNEGLFTNNESSEKKTLLQAKKMTFDVRSNRYYIASERGIFVLDEKKEGEKTVQYWRSITQSLPVRIPSVDAIALHPTNKDVLYFTTDSIAIYKTFNGGRSWDSSYVRYTVNGQSESLKPNIGKALLIDTINPNVVYMGIQFKEGK